MNDFYNRINSRLQKIDEKVAQVNGIKPVDDQHRKEIDEARNKLAARKSEALADKQTGADYRKAHDEAEQAKTKAKQAQELSDEWATYHENQKQRLGRQYPGSYDPATNTINPAAMPAREWETYEKSRKNRDQALLNKRIGEVELYKALAKRQQAGQKYASVVKKIKDAYPADNDITDPCIPCKPTERQQKFDRVKEAFLGGQSFGNCGIQSSNQVLKLVDCAEKDETELLKKSLKNGNAELVEKPPRTPEQLKADAKDPAAAKAAKDKIIDDIEPTRPGNGAVSAGGIGQNRSKPVDQSASDHNETIIDTGLTGGTGPADRQKIMKGEGTETTLKDPTPDEISKNLKANKVMVFSTDVSRLGPAEDENGQPVDGWFYTADTTDSKGVVHKAGTPKQVGGHAITVADGKFDKNGKLTHVLVSDTGQGKMYYMKIDDFENSLRPNRKMNVSKEPMKMKCP